MKHTDNNPINSRVHDRLEKIFSAQRFLAVGLLLITFSSTIYSHQEEIDGKDMIIASEHQAHLESIQQEIDQQLYDVFANFFDEEDTTPFSKTVGKIVSILKTKRKILHGQNLTECDELIKTFEKNKYNSSFPVWAKILITPELLNLMSPQTRTYINNLSIQVKINSLIKKLKK